MTRQRLGSSRGAAMIEMVLVLPLFLAVVLGAIDWGWYFVERQTVVNAVRQGARTASVQDTEGDAEAAAIASVNAYLTTARSAARAFTVVDPTVEFSTISGQRVITVRLDGYPSPPISGLRISGLLTRDGAPYTLVPTTISAAATMRLEIQPPP
jgi:Flp pilus assembly protein TadG